jgi:hypothetical protein
MMAPVDMQGIPLQLAGGMPPQAIPPQMQSPQVPPSMGMPSEGAQQRGGLPGGAPFAPGNVPSAQNPLLQTMGAEPPRAAPNIYEKAYPQLNAGIQNKLDKMSLANPSSVQKMQYLDNIKHTIKGIDPDVITAYGGAAGAAKYKTDQSKIAMGGHSKDFANWQQFAQTQAPILAGQIRQFYGDSIQPAMQRMIEDTFNTDSLMRNPEGSIKKMQEILRIINTEGQTYAKPVGELRSNAQTGGGFGARWDKSLGKRENEIEEMQNKPTKKGKSDNSLKENAPAKKAAIKKAITEEDIKKGMLETGYKRDEVIDMLERYGEVM